MKQRYLVAAVGMAVPVIAFTVWARQPSVTTTNVQQPQVQAATTQNDTRYVNDYLSMNIPSEFSEKPAQIGTGRPLFIQQLLTIAPTSERLLGDQIAVVVGALPSGGLREVADVHMRLRSTDYTQIDTTLVNTVAFKSSKDARYEVGYFIQNDALYASIVWTTTLDRVTHVNEHIRTLVNSIVWR